MFISAAFLIAALLAGQQTTGFKPALLIVDIQDFYFPSATGPGLVGADEAAAAALEILDSFRKNSLPVIHIRHDAAQGAGIHKSVTPLEGEKVITKQTVNSFVATDLYDFLMQKGISRLVIIGMQTHMCLEAAARAASDFGFDCIVISDACATRDLQFGDVGIKAAEVQASTFASLTYGRYARVITLENFKSDPMKFFYGDK